MAQCYHRKVAWITSRGLSFRPVKGAEVCTVPCGGCIACRVNNAASWATRIMHEYEYAHDEGVFVTLTYDDQHLPTDKSISKAAVQGFLKRLRINISRHDKGSIRAFVACGEYGALRGRPHYHLVILGWQPSDLVFFQVSPKTHLPVFRSAFLEQAWEEQGFVVCGTLTAASAAYVGRYTKKMVKDDHADGRTPPFFLASRNIPLTNGQQGALGAQWVLDHHDRLNLGYVRHPDHTRDIKCKIPDYYFDLLNKWYPEQYEQLKDYRYDYAMRESSGLMFCANPSTRTPSIYVAPDRSADEESRLVNLLKDFLGTDSDDLRLLLSNAEKKCVGLYETQKFNLLKLKRNFEK